MIPLLPLLAVTGAQVLLYGLVPAWALGRFKWAGALAAVCLLLVGVWSVWRGPDAPPYPGAIALADRTEVEWVETDLPDAFSMVYEDADTGLTVIWVMVDEPGEEDEHAI